MKTKIILLLLSFTSYFLAQENTTKRLFNVQGDIKNPTFFFNANYYYDYYEGNSLLFEIHNDSSANIYVSHYDSKTDSFSYPIALTNNNASNINPSGKIYDSENKIIIFQTNINGNWDIAYRKLKNNLWENIKILSDTTGDETNPIFANSPNYGIDSTCRILFEKNNSIYMYEKTDSTENNIIILNGSSSAVFSQPTAKFDTKKINGKYIDGFKITAKFDSSGIKKIVSVFKPLDEKADTNFSIVDSGKIDNPKYQMINGFDISLTYEKENNIYIEDPYDDNNIVPFKDSVIGRIYNLNTFFIQRPVIKALPRANDFSVFFPSTYINSRNDSTFIFLYDRSYVMQPDSFVYSKVKDNHPTAGVAGYKIEQGYEEIDYIVWEDSIDGDIQLFGNKYIQTLGGVNENETPNNFYLFQNYPNPFNPTTKIEFYLIHGSFTKLIIYNSLGEKVKELINSYLPSGKHEINFNASSFASGVYFYQLNVGDFIQTRKMILLR